MSDGVCGFVSGVAIGLVIGLASCGSVMEDQILSAYGLPNPQELTIRQSILEGSFPCKIGNEDPTRDMNYCRRQLLAIIDPIQAAKVW